MIILSIETSCDETAMAVVEAEGGLRAPRFRILKNIVSSQIKIHAPHGGVVPNLAKREHLKNLPIILRQVLGKWHMANSKTQNHTLFAISHKPAIDLIAVTVGPGLEPALWTGIEFAKKITNDLRQTTNDKKLRLLGANHLEGHLYSFLFASELSRKSSVVSHKLFPAIGLIVSGGHTILVRMDSLARYKKIGETRDDAAGEAFDKVARMLGLPYPGGPEVEKLARRGNPNAIPFPRPMLHTKNYDFSFSGLKTAVLYYLRDNRDPKHPNTPELSEKKFGSFGSNSDHSDRLRADVAASFQQAVIDVLVQKTMRAAQEFGARSVMLSGGVAANKALQKNLRRMTNNLRLNFFVPPPSLNTDNAVMIAGAAYINHLRRKNYTLAARGNLNL